MVETQCVWKLWTEKNLVHVCFHLMPSCISTQAGLPHLPLLVLGEQSAVEVFQCQLGHGHPLSGVVAHGKGSCSPSRHGHTIL